MLVFKGHAQQQTRINFSASSQAKEAKVEAKSALDAMKEAGHGWCFFGVASSNLVLNVGMRMWKCDDGS